MSDLDELCLSIILLHTYSECFASQVFKEGNQEQIDIIKRKLLGTLVSLKNIRTAIYFDTNKNVVLPISPPLYIKQGGYNNNNNNKFCCVEIPLSFMAIRTANMSQHSKFVFHKKLQHDQIH